MTTLETGPTVSDSGATRLQIDQTRQTEVAEAYGIEYKPTPDKGNDEQVGVEGDEERHDRDEST